MLREEKLAVGVANLEGLPGVTQGIGLSGCGSGREGKLRRWHILPPCPRKHFRVKRIGLFGLAPLAIGYGEECHRPCKSPRHGQGRFPRRDRFVQLSINVQDKLEKHLRQKGLRIQFHGAPASLYGLESLTCIAAGQPVYRVSVA